MRITRIAVALALASAGILLAVLGGTDINLITGAETHPKVTQHDSVVWGHGDTVVVVYRDGRESPNTCGISVSTNGGETFTRITPSPFGVDCSGNPSVFYSVRAAKWFFSANGGGCALGQWESFDGINWTSSGCILTSGPPSNHSTWVDNNPGSPNYGRQWVAFNVFGDGRVKSNHSTDDGVTWSFLDSLNTTFQRVVKMTGSLGTDGSVFVQTLYDGVQGGLIGRRTLYLYRFTNADGWREFVDGPTFVDGHTPGRVVSIAPNRIRDACMTPRDTGGTKAGVKPGSARTASSIMSFRPGPMKAPTRATSIIFVPPPSSTA